MTNKAEGSIPGESSLGRSASRSSWRLVGEAGPVGILFCQEREEAIEKPFRGCRVLPGEMSGREALDG